MRVEASPEAVAFIREHGGQLFVWPTVHRSYRLALTLLRTSTDPPSQALEFRRFDAVGFLLFLHPAIRRLPERIELLLRGRRHPHVAAYWDGLAYVV